MARLSIATWSAASQVAIDAPQQVLSVSLSGTSAASSAITGPSGAIMIVRLCADAACDYTQAANPTAVAGTDRYLPAGAIEYVGVKVGDKIAAINHS